eukprot:8467120-Heterocapsa_arctica.AAC.1
MQGTPDPAAAPQRHGPPRSALTTAPPSTAARPELGAEPQSTNGAGPSAGWAPLSRLSHRRWHSPLIRPAP